MTLEDFNEKVIQSEDLQKQVKATNNIQEFIDLVRRNGVKITEDSLIRELNKPIDKQIIMDDDIKEVAGGLLSQQDLRDEWDVFKYGFCEPVPLSRALVEVARGRTIDFKK